jgi:NAD(P) transhydrogenase subunit alpha
MIERTAVGVLKEHAPGEHRVALVPGAVPGLIEAGFDVVVEYGAGARAGFGDAEYHDAGAAMAGPDELRRRCDVLVCVDPPPEEGPVPLRGGQVLLGMLQPLRRHRRVRDWARRGVTAVSLDRLPRTLSRAQAMDALTSQANVAGYRAVLVAAHAYRGFLPMLTTATGTVRPAAVLVLGCGVAGLAAVATARRLGAAVSAFDVRPEAVAEAASLGAAPLDLGVDAAGEGGYARALTDDEARRQRDRLADAIGRFDIVITTAQVPGGAPPLLVTQEAIGGMRPGSVLVDLAAGPLGGNIAGSEPDESVEPVPGVTLIGAPNLPSEMAPAASTAYARNVTTMLLHLAPEGRPVIDPGDEIQRAVLVAHGGEVLDRAVAERLQPEGAAA